MATPSTGLVCFEVPGEIARSVKRLPDQRQRLAALTAFFEHPTGTTSTEHPAETHLEPEQQESAAAPEAVRRQPTVAADDAAHLAADLRPDLAGSSSSADVPPSVDWARVHQQNVGSVYTSGANEVLWHFSDRPPEEVFVQGIAPAEPDRVVALEYHVSADPLDQFVSTTRDPELWHDGARYRYRIHPWLNGDTTGVDINASVDFDTYTDLRTLREEREVAFNSFVSPASIASVYDSEHRSTGFWNPAAGRVAWHRGTHDRPHEKTRPDQASPPYQGWVDVTTWQQVGGQLGANHGGTYRSGDGLYYVKQAQSADHARSEVLAARLYSSAGIRVPEMYPALLNGSPATASRIIGGATQTFRGDIRSPAYLASVRRGFAVDVWLGHWDVVGVDYDNIVTAGHRPYRIDFGGTLAYRPAGLPKGDDFGGIADEWDTLRDHDINPECANVFAPMTSGELRVSAALVRDLPLTEMRAALESVGFSREKENRINALLVRRRNDILRRVQAMGPVGGPYDRRPALDYESTGSTAPEEEDVAWEENPPRIAWAEQQTTGEVDTERWIPFAGEVDAFEFVHDSTGRAVPSRPGASGERTRVAYAWTWLRYPDGEEELRLTRNLRLEAVDADEEEVERLKRGVQHALKTLVNEPGYRVPVPGLSDDPGPVLHVAVHFTDSSADAHDVIQVRRGEPTGRQMVQSTWFTGVSAEGHVHEELHSRGIWDDLTPPGALLTPGGRNQQEVAADETSLMGRFSADNLHLIPVLTKDHLRQIGEVFAPYAQSPSSSARKSEGEEQAADTVGSSTPAPTSTSTSVSTSTTVTATATAEQDRPEWERAAEFARGAHLTLDGEGRVRLSDGELTLTVSVAGLSPDAAEGSTIPSDAAPAHTPATRLLVALAHQRLDDGKFTPGAVDALLVRARQLMDGRHELPPLVLGADSDADLAAATDGAADLDAASLSRRDLLADIRAVIAHQLSLGEEERTRQLSGAGAEPVPDPALLLSEWLRRHFHTEHTDPTQVAGGMDPVEQLVMGLESQRMTGLAPTQQQSYWIQQIRQGAVALNPYQRQRLTQIGVLAPAPQTAAPYAYPVAQAGPSHQGVLPPAAAHPYGYQPGAQQSAPWQVPPTAHGTVPHGTVPHGPVPTWMTAPPPQPPVQQPYAAAPSPEDEEGPDPVDLYYEIAPAMKPFVTREEMDEEEIMAGENMYLTTFPRLPDGTLSPEAVDLYLDVYREAHRSSLDNVRAHAEITLTNLDVERLRGVAGPYLAEFPELATLMESSSAQGGVDRNTDYRTRRVDQGGVRVDISSMAEDPFRESRERYALSMISTLQDVGLAVPPRVKIHLPKYHRLLAVTLQPDGTSLHIEEEQADDKITHDTYAVFVEPDTILISAMAVAPRPPGTRPGVLRAVDDLLEDGRFGIVLHEGLHMADFFHDPRTYVDRHNVEFRPRYRSVVRRVSAYGSKDAHEFIAEYGLARILGVPFRDQDRAVLDQIYAALGGPVGRFGPRLARAPRLTRPEFAYLFPHLQAALAGMGASIHPEEQLVLSAHDHLAPFDQWRALPDRVGPLARAIRRLRQPSLPGPGGWREPVPASDNGQREGSGRGFGASVDLTSAQEDSPALQVARALADVPEGVEQPVAARTEATRLLAGLLRHDGVRQRLLDGGARVIVVPASLSLPELMDSPRFAPSTVDAEEPLSEGTLPSAEVRGWTSASRPLSFVSEENLLGLGTGPAGRVHREGYSSALHEMAHLVYRYGLDEEQRAGVQAEYERQLAAGEDGQWVDGPLRSTATTATEAGRTGNYASTGVEEFFAQTVLAYFGANAGRDPLTGEARNNGAPWVAEHLPPVHALLEELVGAPPVEPLAANALSVSDRDAHLWEALADHTRLTEGPLAEATRTDGTRTDAGQRPAGTEPAETGPAEAEPAEAEQPAAAEPGEETGWDRPVGAAFPGRRSTMPGPDAVSPERARAIARAWQESSQLRGFGGFDKRSPGVTAIDTALQQWTAAVSARPGDLAADRAGRTAVGNALDEWRAGKSSSQRMKAADALQRSLDGERRRIEDESGYASVAELVRDLHASARVADVRGAEHGPLGPDLFGVRAPVAVPDFLREGGLPTGRPYDYSRLNADESVHFLVLLDMLRTPTAAEMDPSGWNVPLGTHSLSSQRPSRQWAPARDARPLPSRTVDVTMLVYGNWFGTTLKPTGPSAGSWARFREAARSLGGEATFVLFSDRPRAAMAAVRDLAEPPMLEPNRSDWFLVRWAREGSIKLVNLHEAVAVSGGSRLLPLIRTELAKQTPQGYAAASDAARVFELKQWGGLYSDPDNEIISLDFLREMGSGRRQDTFAIGSGPEGAGIVNNPVAATRHHPLPALQEEVLLDNYGLTQPELFQRFGPRFPRPARMRRNSVLFRTGTALHEALEQAGYTPETAPVIPESQARVNYDNSWLSAPETGARRRWTRQDTAEFTRKVVHSMVRSLYYRAGDLHLTPLKDAVVTHADPALVWSAAFAFLSERSDLRPMLRSVSYSDPTDPDGDTWELIHDLLPASAAGLLRSSSRTPLLDLNGQWLDEEPVGARLLEGPGRHADQGTHAGTQRPVGASASASHATASGTADHDAATRAGWIADAFPWLASVNPLLAQGDEFATNCVLTTIAVEFSLADGEPHRAGASEAQPARALVDFADGRTVRTFTDFGEVTSLMADAPRGARGVVITWQGAGAHHDPDAADHAFNVVNHPALGVVYLDGQTGGEAELPAGPHTLQFLAMTDGIIEPPDAHTSGRPAETAPAAETVATEETATRAQRLAPAEPARPTPASAPATALRTPEPSRPIAFLDTAPRTVVRGGSDAVRVAENAGTRAGEEAVAAEPVRTGAAENAAVDDVSPGDLAPEDVDALIARFRPEVHPALRVWEQSIADPTSTLAGILKWPGSRSLVFGTGLDSPVWAINTTGTIKWFTLDVRAIGTPDFAEGEVVSIDIDNRGRLTGPAAQFVQAQGGAAALGGLKNGFCDVNLGSDLGQVLGWHTPGA
ncbi:Papain fold toxin 1, glutamine deamidase [Actinacidiphila yanglinensis]|uniref:Papain fold toxin 1, glutamine deamidase n=1 Tax=Actinacidiphila yanglinensis TaxID=310779 RepID=A0A1H6E179_9ACTN|nr:toxin glutamine deamidase domain-containing protein [Actinacidiphila yanglinensis]SEG91378.1 Papain fold toxin 1, glutamine deamidase [Actinacidiphila yanglinensis]